MANFTPDRSGQDNGAGDARALFLTKFAGEILQLLPQVISTKDMVRVKTLNGGKDFQFPYTGTLTPAYHTPGVELTGSTGNNSAKTIGLDDLLVVDRFTPKIDKWMQHFDDRQAYARQMSEGLGITMDQHVFIEAVKGSLDVTEVVTGSGDIGTLFTDADFVSATLSLKVAAFKNALKQAAKQFKEQDVPDHVKKVLYVPWETYFDILDNVDTNGFSFFNKDYASGSIEAGMLPPIYGITVKGTNNILTTDLSADAALYQHHQQDMRNVRGIIMCEGAVATVKASDITVEADPYQARYKGQLLTADYLAGHGYLRQECLIVLRDATPV